MKKSKNKILWILIVIAILLISISIIIYPNDPVQAWQAELAKGIMELGVTAIIGGFIKFLFDQHQQKEIEGREGEKKEEDKKAAQNEFRNELLNRLRKIFDAIDSARLLIEAHKSAKTYGDKMRDSVIPSIVALYDIKRSLADSVDMMEIEKIKHLRLSLHYMIAYLQALANEFKNEYLEISNSQSYEEEWKKQTKEKLIRSLLSDDKKEISRDVFSSAIKSGKTPVKAWQQIEQLPLMGRFIEDTYDSLYRKLFIDFYEYAKRILKDQETKRLPEKFNAAYLITLDEIDLKKSTGEITVNDSLVNRIIKDLIKSET